MPLPAAGAETVAAARTSAGQNEIEPDFVDFEIEPDFVDFKGRTLSEIGGSVKLKVNINNYASIRVCKKKHRNLFDCWMQHFRKFYE